jgi:4a-hydroxytetrahydrobiopterin dehydratase
MDLVPASVIEAALETLGWELDGPELVKVVRRRDFADAIAYVNAVAQLAESVNHHPDIDLRWDTVTLRLLTHSRGGITDADLSLAAAIDQIA